MDEFGLGVELAGVGFEQVIARTRLALRANGFGVLSEMDVPTTIGGPGRQHLFMAVWQSIISTQDLGMQGTEVGDHLACNVVIFEADETCTVAFLDPGEGYEGWPDADDVIGRARKAIDQVLAQVEEASSD